MENITPNKMFSVSEGKWTKIAHHLKYHQITMVSNKLKATEQRHLSGMWQFNQPNAALCFTLHRHVYFHLLAFMLCCQGVDHYRCPAVGEHTRASWCSTAPPNRTSVQKQKVHFRIACHHSNSSCKLFNVHTLNIKLSPFLTGWDLVLKRLSCNYQAELELPCLFK